MRRGEDDDIVVFTVPGLPRGKGRPKIVKIGGFSRMAADKKTASYEGLVAHEASIAMREKMLVDQPVSCALMIFVPIPNSWSIKKKTEACLGTVLPTTKPDIDNVVKAIFDGMNGVVWRDDVLCVDVVVRKRYSHTPCVKIAVKSI